MDAELFTVSPGYETRMRMLQALDILMKSQSLDDLTVTDICKTAGISRQTFYRYFIDKYEVITWHHVTIAERSLARIGRDLSWREARYRCFLLMLEERSFYQNSLRSQGDYNSLVNFGARLVERYYRETLVDWKHVEMTEDLEFQLAVSCKYAAEIVADWAVSGMKIAPERFAQLMDTIVPQELYALLNEPGETSTARPNLASQRKLDSNHG